MSFWRWLFRSPRARRRLRALVASFDRQWRDNTLAATFEGAGEIAIAVSLGRSHGLTREVRVRLADGGTLDIPAGLVIELFVSLPMRDGLFYATAGTPYSLYTSARPVVDVVYRGARRLAPGTRLVLHRAGYSPRAVLEPHI